MFLYRTTGLRWSVRCERTCGRCFCCTFAIAFVAVSSPLCLRGSFKHEMRLIATLNFDRATRELEYSNFGDCFGRHDNTDPISKPFSMPRELYISATLGQWSAEIESNPADFPTAYTDSAKADSQESPTERRGAAKTHNSTKVTFDNSQSVIPKNKWDFLTNAQ